MAVHSIEIERTIHCLLRLFNARCSLLVVHCTFMKINWIIIDCSMNHKYPESNIEVQRYQWLIKVVFCYYLTFILVEKITFFDWIDFWVLCIGTQFSKQSNGHFYCAINKVMCKSYLHYTHTSSLTNDICILEYDPQIVIQF